MIGVKVEVLSYMALNTPISSLQSRLTYLADVHMKNEHWLIAITSVPYGCILTGSERSTLFGSTVKYSLKRILGPQSEFQPLARQGPN